MKKKAILLIATAALFACSNSENENDTTSSTEKVKVEEKKEVMKDYDYFIDRIQRDAKWMERVKAKAIELGITEEEALIKNATFMAKQNGFMLVDETQKELEKQISVIKKNKEWLEKLERQAAERGISIDEMIERAAKYVIEQRKLTK